MRFKSFLIILLCILLVPVLLSCHKKDKTDKQKGKHVHSKNAVAYTNKDKFDFSILDTLHYFYGTVDSTQYFVKIDHITDNSILGRYYKVSNKETTIKVTHFEISYIDKDYTFCAGDESKDFKFSIVIDPELINGSFTEKSLANITQESHAFEFTKFSEPEFTEYTSKKYIEPQYEVTKKSNVSYGKAPGYWASYPNQEESYAKLILKTMGKTAKTKEVNLDMDIYLPEDKDNCKHPLIVLFHGGGFYVGDKGCEAMAGWCQHFAKLGYVTASVNYRMGFKLSKASIQECGYKAIQDAHAALRYLSAHADEYGIDKDNIFIGGTSAGSITALAVTFMTNSTRPAFVFENKLDEELGGLEASGNNLGNTFHIKALANMWGAVYDLEVLSNHRIPVISFHGTGDNIVPYDEGFPFSNIKSKIGERMFDKMYGSKSIQGYLSAHNIRNELHSFDGAPHAPYQEKNGKLNDRYYFIQDKIQNFFYHELTAMKSIRKDAKHPRHYTLSEDDIKNVSWKVDGGFYMSAEDNGIEVIWRSDAKKRTITASGIRNNGAPFLVTTKF